MFDGEFTAFEIGAHYGTPMITSVTVTIENDEITDFYINTLQLDGDTFEWNVKTKKELGYKYKMHYNTYSATDDTPTLAEYQTWLEDNEKLEWFEQVKLITDYIVENGWESSFAVEDIDASSSVSVSIDAYEEVLSAVFAKVE